MARKAVEKSASIDVAKYAVMLSLGLVAYSLFWLTVL